jgi:hypothetical protein
VWGEVVDGDERGGLLGAWLAIPTPRVANSPGSCSWGFVRDGRLPPAKVRLTPRGRSISVEKGAEAEPSRCVGIQFDGLLAARRGAVASLGVVFGSGCRAGLGDCRVFSPFVIGVRSVGVGC